LPSSVWTRAGFSTAPVNRSRTLGAVALATLLLIFKEWAYVATYRLYLDHRVDDDHWEQPGNLFRMMTSAQRQLLFENTARAMGDAKLHIKQRHVANCTRADPAYGAGVVQALGLDHHALAAAE